MLFFLGKKGPQIIFQRELISTRIQTGSIGWSDPPDFVSRQEREKQLQFVVQDSR